MSRQIRLFHGPCVPSQLRGARERVLRRSRSKECSTARRLSRAPLVPSATSRTRGTERTDQTRPADDRTESSTEARPTRGSERKTASRPTKSAEPEAKPQVKDGQPSAPQEAPADTTEIAETDAALAIVATLLTAEAPKASVGGDAPETIDAETATAPEQTADTGDAPESADAATVDVAAALIVPVAAPAPAPANTVAPAATDAEAVAAVETAINAAVPPKALRHRAG